ncbi:MAG: band-7 C-terminal domain-containing protein, partial [Ginsengibacter sp.]
SINEEGGMNAVNLRIAEQYLTEFGKLAKTNNSMIVPADLSDIAGVITSITSVLNRTKAELLIPQK